MDGLTQQRQLIERLRRGYRERQAWVASLSAAQRDEAGTPEHWSAKDFIAHIAFWHGYWAGRLAAARRGELAPESVEGPDNALVFEANRDRPWPEVLAAADGAYQALLAQAEGSGADELFGPQYGAVMQAGNAGQRVGITGYWHIFEHQAQYQAERGNLARATEIQEAAAGERIAQAEDPRERGVTLYNLACFYATTGRPSEALARLPEALRLAPDLAEYAQHDSDFDSLRADPAYRALMQR